MVERGTDCTPTAHRSAIVEPLDVAPVIFMTTDHIAAEIAEAATTDVVATFIVAAERKDTDAAATERPRWPQPWRP